MNARIVVIHNIPSPYRLHMFEMMWRKFSERGVDFIVYSMGRGLSIYPDQWVGPKIVFPHQYSHNFGFRNYFFNPGIILKILINKPDWLFVGNPYDTFTGILASLICKAKRSRIAWCEGNAKTLRSMSGFKGWLKRFIYSKYEYAAVPGEEARKFLSAHQKLTHRAMPVPLTLPNLIDEKMFRPREEWSDEEIISVRKKVGVVAGERLCVIPARLTPVKGLVEFVDMLDSSMLMGWRILVVGDGPLRCEIESQLSRRGLSQFFVMRHFVAYEDMPSLYAASDLFLLPSLQDMNPLSVVEALHSGLPIALSDAAGNVDEAVTDGRNGWRLPVRDAENCRLILREIFSTPLDRLREMGKISKHENAVFWDSEKSIENFVSQLIGEK